MNSIYLADGREIKAEVQPHTYQSRTVQFEDRAIIVEKLPGAYQHYGYGERVSIKLANGEAISTVLQPQEYEHHRASVDVGAVEHKIAQLRNPDAIIVPGKVHVIEAVYDQQTGQWIEATQQEGE